MRRLSGTEDSARSHVSATAATRSICSSSSHTKSVPQIAPVIMGMPFFAATPRRTTYSVAGRSHSSFGAKT